MGAVLVAHDSAAVLPRALAALVPQVGQVVVVDNASSDALADALEPFGDAVRCLRLDRNIGFGAANNIGFGTLEREFALTVNPDAVLAPDAVEALVDAADRYPDACIIAPMLTDPDGRPQQCWREFPHDRERHRSRVRSDHAATPPMPDGPLCAATVTGAVMLIRTAFLRDHGGFDAEYFLYYEDDDLCMRARRAGSSCILEPAARAVHARGSSTRPQPGLERLRHWHMSWSRLHFLARWDDPRRARRTALASWAWYRVKGAFYTLLGSRRRHKNFGKAAGARAFLAGAAANPNVDDVRPATSKPRRGDPT